MIKETRVTTGQDFRIIAEGPADEVGRWFREMTPQGGKWMGANYLRRDEDSIATVIFPKEEEDDDTDGRYNPGEQEGSNDASD